MAFAPGVVSGRFVRPIVKSIGKFFRGAGGASKAKSPPPKAAKRGKSGGRGRKG